MDEILIRRLELRPGSRGDLLCAPPGYAQRLEHPRIRLDPGRRLDFLLLFVADVGDLEARFLGAHRRLRYDGLLWICFPKPAVAWGRADGRNDGWACVIRQGLAGVGRVSLDREWTAARFRPREELAR